MITRTVAAVLIWLGGWIHSWTAETAMSMLLRRLRAGDGDALPILNRLLDRYGRVAVLKPAGAASGVGGAQGVGGEWFAQSIPEGADNNGPTRN